MTLYVCDGHETSSAFAGHKTRVWVCDGHQIYRMKERDLLQQAYSKGIDAIAFYRVPKQSFIKPCNLYIDIEVQHRSPFEESDYFNELVESPVIPFRLRLQRWFGLRVARKVYLMPGNLYVLPTFDDRSRKDSPASDNDTSRLELIGLRSKIMYEGGASSPS